MSEHGWNFADVWERIADTIPDAPALTHADTRRTWAEFDRRADGVARTLLDNGAQRQDKVAQYLYNCSEYMESVFATFKAGLAPVNTNYRYVDDELVYLWDNADVVAVVFHGTFSERIAGLRDRVPRIVTWLWVDDGAGPCPEWATPYETAATSASERTVPAHGRSGDDLLLLYTGGTTGMPKGVMWRQDDLYNNFSLAIWHDPPAPDLDAVTARVKERIGPVDMPACPLMHGTGLFSGMQQLCQGGSVVTLTARHLDVDELLDTIERERVNVLAMVGDAFGKPILRALDADPGRWDISSLIAIVSSGVMFSIETKQGLLKHHGGMLIVDAFSSSEALGMGQSVTGRDMPTRTARFTVGERARVITDDGRDVVPGSGEIGRVAVGGFQPVGYYKDEAKSDATFKVIDGKRYSIPGDYATVEADGTLTLMGRGSVCINTGGEKVFPEEVEEVLKLHAAVRDAVVVGVPDEKFGEAIVAMVEPHPAADVDADDVIAHVKAHLASYKAPKRVVAIETIGRAPNGKVDYKRLRNEAITATGR
ncbi:MAG TPA: acyl-CoA synthetase [Acidimicrobiales bacterium]|jgi:fatty-acyl-CoA synthase|nr:acyl-CoA synthetase [Acidimicrobiales bacterium]